MKKIIGCGVICWLVFCSLVWAAPQASVSKTNITISQGKVYLNLKDADIKSVLQIFGKATGVNIVAGDDVAGKVTVAFSGIEPRAGLEAVLRTRGLDWFEESGTIFVSTKKIMRSYYLANAKPSDLQSSISTILPAGSVVTADDTYNALIIQTTSDYLPRIEKLIKELDIPPLQVMVEARLIEVRVGDDSSAGTDFKYAYQKNPNDTVQNINMAGRPTDNGAQGMYAQLLSGNVEAYLSALTTKTGYNVVATPRLTTLNNKEASILIGSRYGYLTTIVSQTSTTQVVNFLSVGTTLIMKPNVSKNGYVRMKIYPKVSDGSVVNGLPQEKTTELQNEIMVKDGQTFVIGGLINNKDVETDYGIPFVMDIPFIGTFFRKTVINKEKDELLVFVTPHIVTPEFLDTLNKPIESMQQKSDETKARLVH